VAGHISYPRTAAAQNAWADYRHAITLANSGARGAAILLLQDVVDNPNASPYLQQVAAELLTKLNSVAIAAAMISSNAGTHLEGQTAQHIMDAGIHILAFNKEIGPNGAIGEIDIKTPDAIIETTIKRRDKLGQIKDLMTDKQLNPDGKPVILYAPNYGPTAGQAILDAGGYIARTSAELIALLKLLKGR
jgi:hypothetical protein